MTRLTSLASLIVLILLQSCNSTTKQIKQLNTSDSTTIEKQSNFINNIKQLSDKLKSYEAPSQIIKTKTNAPTLIKGLKGTIIYINPNDLETIKGTQLGEVIEVELKELTNQDELLTSNAQTVSNGKLLVSGGAYYINITSNGNKLKLKPGRSLKIQFPKISDKEMSLFYGQQDSLGRMNWQEAKENFIAKNNQAPPSLLIADSNVSTTIEAPKDNVDAIIDYIESDSGSQKITPEQRKKIKNEYKLVEKVYEAMNITSFGWINCDRFLKIENITNLQIKIDALDSLKCANVFLVFKNINSVLQTYCFGKKIDQFTNVPIGIKTRLVAYTVKNQKVYSYSSDYTIKQNDILKINLIQTEEKDFKKLIGQ